MFPWNRKDGYCEYHHIIPISEGGENTPTRHNYNHDGTNIIGLQAREHYIAHLLLVKIYQDEKMFSALSKMMCVAPNQKRNFKFNSKLYEKLRIKCGRKHSDFLKNSEKIIRYDINGKLMSISEISELTGTPRSTIIGWIKKGIKPYQIINKKPKEINKKYEFNGISKTITEWEKFMGWNKGFIRHRIEIGWTFEKIMTTKKTEPLKIDYNGKSYTVNELSKILKISKSQIRRRIKNNSKIDKPSIITNKGIIYNYKNISATLPQFAKMFNLNLSSLRSRIYGQKLSIKEAIEKPFK